MTTAARDSGWLGVASRLGAVAALVAAVLVLSAYPFDDAFIHLRLARNLAFQGEPYSNFGERVMSGSSPLWLFWLSAIFRVTGHASVRAAIITECLVIAAVFFTAEGFLARPHGGALPGRGSWRRRDRSAGLDGCLRQGRGLRADGGPMRP